MKEKILFMGVSCPPDDLSVDDRINWFLERFGKTLGLEVALSAYSMIDEYSEVEITIKVRPYPKNA